MTNATQVFGSVCLANSHRLVCSTASNENIEGSQMATFFCVQEAVRKKRMAAVLQEAVL